MLFKQLKISCGAALAAVFLVTAPQPALSAEADTVTLYRGAQATAVRIPAGGPLRVQRGTALRTVAYGASKAKGTTGARTLHAGERLWIVDTDSGRLTACVLRHSTQVGRQDIRCFTRGLPSSLAPTTD